MAEAVNTKYKNLKDYPFPKILLGIKTSGKTGILHLKNWPAEKLIYIKDGKIISATSNIESDCLGNNLLTKGRISVAQYYESIRLLEKSGKKHGSILVELGFLSQKDIEDSIKEQVEDIILSIFRWEDGYFFFEETNFNIDASLIIDSDIVTLIYKGIKNMDSFPQLRNALPLTTTLKLSSGSQKLFKKFKFDNKEKGIIDMIDGKNSVLDIITRFSGDNMETLKLIYALNSMEAALPVDHVEPKKEAMFSTVKEASSSETLYTKGTELFMKGKYSASVNTFREAISLSPDKAAYHFYLAMSLVKTSKFEEAENALIKAIEIEPFNDDYYTELGMIYKKKGLAEKAGKTLEFALRINPHNERARQTLSEMKK